MRNLPEVSVIMSVHNGERYLHSAIASILNQSFRDFEFIIVDDASTDSTSKIINQYADNRIRVICNKTNIGLTRSLNKALKTAEGKYIARMDCDDISFPRRLEKQVKFLNANEDIYLISCGYREFGKRFGRNQIRMREEEIKAQYLFGSVLPHSGFMFRMELVNKYHIFYNDKMKYAQDYDFQVRVSSRFHIACLPEILMYYRISEEQISVRKSSEQRAYANMVRYYVFREYNICCNKRQIEILSKVYCGEKLITLIEWASFAKLFLSVYRVLYKEESIESQYIISKMFEYVKRLKL